MITALHPLTSLQVFKILLSTVSCAVFKRRKGITLKLFYIRRQELEHINSLKPSRRSVLNIGLLQIFFVPKDIWVLFIHWELSILSTSLHQRICDLPFPGLPCCGHRYFIILYHLLTVLLPLCPANPSTKSRHS